MLIGLSRLTRRAPSQKPISFLIFTGLDICSSVCQLSTFCLAFILPYHTFIVYSKIYFVILSILRVSKPRTADQTDAIRSHIQPSDSLRHANSIPHQHTSESETEGLISSNYPGPCLLLPSPASDMGKFAGGPSWTELHNIKRCVFRLPCK